MVLFSKKRLFSCGEARYRALQQVEMDEKCLLKLQEDKTEVVKSKKKPKKMEAPTPKVPQVQSSPRVPLCGRGYNALGVSRVPQPPRSLPLGQREPLTKTSIQILPFIKSFPGVDILPDSG